VLYAPGLGARAESNVELAEFLASHGYVVAIVPQLGSSATDLANGRARTSTSTRSTMRFQRIAYLLPFRTCFMVISPNSRRSH
jgi:predicted dienelactone hydrolase